ncbi:nucleotidyltransferase/DNA polymerase involved in DNA repair [Halomonas campaniensis]|uniref:Nucleotidyltransferase/DNA polymerase involved in DNA repair n=1 Tax=Halomonas campaniensis TaxID=213554 RepID=A0A7W5JZJ3_9GAMM|nr:helix-hairpin-helix domain-containing protein [Halomonas campaniensis]MBB3329204.1 nucleotidyltransferase/DNA polymerase involved in DNA repair [Halomonas campaniensis]
MHDDLTRELAEREFRHAIALELREMARRARRALLIALASDTHGEDALAELEQADRALAELDALAARHAFVALPMLGDVRRGVDRLACQLYQDGACDSLDEDAHEAFLNRHARGLTALDGIGPVTARRLFAHGISDLDQLRALGPEGLDAITGLNAATLARIRASLAADAPAADAK